MKLGRFEGSLDADARPVGWQDVVNPRLTRRGLLGGLAATPVLLYAGAGDAADVWYDLEFVLSDDHKILTVLEIEVTPQRSPGADAPTGASLPEIRSIVCEWNVPAMAFGPKAFFDMAEPAELDISAADPAASKTFFLRNVQYGMRFGRNDSNTFKVRGQKPGFVAFTFKRRRRWTISYLTDLWLLSSGKPDSLVSSRSALFHVFLGKSLANGFDPNSPDDARQRPFEDIVHSRVGQTLDIMFSHQVNVGPGATGDLRIFLDRDLVWTVRRMAVNTLVVQERQVRLKEFGFAWRRTAMPDAGQENVVTGSKAAAVGETAYFSGNAGPDDIEIASVDGCLDIGRADGHHVKVRPGDRCSMHFDVIVGPAPTRPKDLQVVSALRLGEGVLAVGDGAEILSDGVAGRNLVLTRTDTPAGSGQLRRTALWGDATGRGPFIGRPMPETSRWHQRGEVMSPVGRLRVGEPVRAKAEEKLDAGSKTGTNGAGKNAGKATATPSSGPGTVLTVTRPSPSCAVPGDDQADQTQEQLVRFFQAANGDRGGASDATLHVLHDRPLTEGASGSMRRIHFDLSLFGINTALPDTSFSALTFRQAPLRLIYEDGQPIAELIGGEYPRPLTSSFVWLGREVDRAACFDLSSATLTCGRDYDLMKLRLRFHDLLLEYSPAPKVRPAREDARVWIGEDGAVHDSRPILVAEFDPQHVMEEAIFRPETQPLPDVELEKPLNAGLDDKTWTRERILKELAAAKDETARTKFRKDIQEAKILAEEDARKKQGMNAPRPFKEMADAFAKHATGLPPDQQLYIGAIALDPDGMAIARGLMAQIGPAAVRFEVNEMLRRIAALAVRGGPLDAAGHLLPLLDLPEDVAFRNALRNEATFEAMEPLYGVFRGFWRDRIALYRALAQHGMPLGDIENKLGFRIPPKAYPVMHDRLGEFLSANNRPPKYEPTNAVEALVEAIREAFVNFALGGDPVPPLVGARLSGRSRLAFRIECEAPVGANVREANTRPSSGDGPGHAGPGTPAFLPIPFTFEALTDWSRYEPAVTKRARKLFTALPSGLLPQPGSRSANPSDHAMMRFQGFSQAPTTGAARMAEVQASLKSERIADVESGAGQPFPGEPLDFETAIEIPSRLTLSTAQDAIWRTNRRMPPQVYSVTEPAPPIIDMTAGLEEGQGLAGPTSFSAQPRDLWTVRLETGGDTPSLRAVSSPDLRPRALGYRGGEKRLPGEGAPPRGPYAPWLIGPEQMESGTLKAEDMAEANGSNLCAAPEGPNKYRLIRWLCERAGLRTALPVEDYTIFRTSLDAFDRHQLVLLSSAYGLPVIGKRLAKPGADKDDVERSGGLIANSGQIEPGEAFSLLDASDDQALHKPVPLNVKALSLSALGGSFLHETAFKPSAGADDLLGRKIFEGFAIDTLQQDIVLGRDIRTEVVYKGYLVPLGHKASFVKLTERVFIRTPGQGIKAMLRQRMFLRMTEPDKLYGALGQPHSGRMWCGKRVRLLADKTPDILDPTFDLGTLSPAKPETLNGRIHLGGEPGLAFWPRTDITEKGLYHFEVTIDGTPTSLPMIFVDNIAATTPASLKAVADHYNGNLPGDHNAPLRARLVKNRTLPIGGRKIDFAPNSKSGEAQFETDEIAIRAHGRSLVADSTKWTGDLEGKDNFLSTGVLQGAGQPPVYPAMERARIRLGAVERMGGSGPQPVDVQYDGHYVLYGFTEDNVARGLDLPQGTNSNPKEVFLNLRSALTFGMGGNGDRSGGIARPESHIVAISRSKGPLGGDETTWWSRTREQRTPPIGEVTQAKGLPPATDFEGAMAVPGLVSLAYYFNDQIDRPKLKVTESKDAPVAFDSTLAEPTNPGERDQQQWIKQIQSFFSLDAKLLGTIRLKDLMTLLGVKADSIPVLKEVQEFGTAALRAGEQLDGLGNDIRSRVLVPLHDVVGTLRAEWKKLDQSLTEKQGTAEILSLADIYPEIDAGLMTVEEALKKALGTEEAAALVPRLAAVHSAARGLIRGLAIVASNPVERLEDAVIGNLQERIRELTGALNALNDIVARLETFKKALHGTASDAAAETVTAWIFEKTAGNVPPASVDVTAATRLAELLPLGLLPPDLGAILRSFGKDVESDAADLARAVLGSQSPPVKGIGPTLLEAVRDASRDAIRPTIKAAVLALLTGKSPADALKAALEDYVQAVKTPVETARSKAAAELRTFTTSTDRTTRRAALALQTALDRYVDGLLDRALDLAQARYPDEIQALIAGLERLAVAVGSARAVAEAVRDGAPTQILKAGGTFAREVLGIDADEVVVTFRDRVTKGLLESARAAGKRLAEYVPVVDIPILLEEVERCAPLKRKPPRAANLPILDGGQVKASSALLVHLGSALGALNTIREKLPDVEDALNDPNIRIDIAQLRRFNGRLADFIGTGDALLHGLTEELAGLYSDIVDLQVSMRDLDTAMAGDDLNRTAIETIGTLIGHIRRLGSAIANRLGAIVDLTAKFGRDNASFIALGAFAAGVVTYLRAQNVDFDQLDQRTRDILNDLEKDAAAMERALIAAIVPAVDLALKLIGTSVAGTAQGIDAAVAGLQELAGSALGLSLSPESGNAIKALNDVKAQLGMFVDLKVPAAPASLKTLLDAPLKPASPRPTLAEFFRKPSSPSEALSTFETAAWTLRDLEAAVVRAWRGLERRLAGAPEEIRRAAEDTLASSGFFETIATGYAQIMTLRNRLLNQAAGNPFFAPFARRALLVETAPRLGPATDGACDISDDKQENDALAACDRLAQEVKVLAEARSLATLTDPKARASLRQRVAFLMESWSGSRAAPLIIVDQARDMGKDLLRGNVLAAIDLGAFRDQIEDAIAALIPTKVNFSYDFNSTVAKPVDPNLAIFQPKLGSSFGIVVRASFDLRTQKSDYSATAYIGPFDIYLIGGLVDALRLKFGGAAFSMGSGTKARLDVKYEDFKIGKDLEFAQQLQSFLSPKEGNGVFIQPMTRSAGIEAGYGINLGTIGVGATSFFNVSLNVSAELPFGDEESLFKVSLGRRLSPFSMGVLPFVGSGYFSIFAAADGVRGFEAAFEYGGGGGIGYGPLTAQCRISVGVFVRILKVDGKKTTEIYGTFFAGGSASIWIFHFSTSLYVRLGTAEGGSMYGEAIYSFSFSLGIADYDYTITAFRQEKALGSPQSASLPQDDGGTRFAAADAPFGIDFMTTGDALVDTGFVIVNARDQSSDWDTYSGYFNADLLPDTFKGISR